MKNAHYSKLLPWNHADYKTARLAAIARADTVIGGARALVIARKCSRWDAKSIVADVYSASTGRHHTEHEAWECPECGSAKLGRDIAANCCAFSDEAAQP